MMKGFTEEEYDCAATLLSLAEAPWILGRREEVEDPEEQGGNSANPITDVKLSCSDNNSTKVSSSSVEPMQQRKRQRCLDEQLPELPEAFKKMIKELGGKDVKLVIQKTLYKTDTDVGQNRLSMPTSKLRNKDFLTEEEKRVVKAAGIRVPIIDPGLKMKTLVLKMRPMSLSPVYALLSPDWRRVVSENHLEENNRVQLWAYRVEGKLGFAMVKLR